MRDLAGRYGRAYWGLPSILRKHICWEENIPALPDSECHVVEQGEIVPEIEHAVLKNPPTLSHRLVAQGYENPHAWVTCIQNAWLVGEYASPVTIQGRLLLTAFRNAPRILGLESRRDLEVWLSERMWLSEAPVSYENVCPMTNRLEGNYFHWLVEWCGRLEWLEKYREITGQTVKLLLPEAGPKYIKESLILLGWGPDTWITWQQRGSAKRVKNLLIPSFRGTSVSTSPASLRWLRKRLLEDAGASSLEPRNSIYVPRRPGMWRSVNNSDELESFLLRKGFIVLEPHLYSLKEQVQFFAQANLIVGLHGAGLTNVLLSPGARLIELFGSYGDAAYFGMTSRLNQSYESVICDSVEDNIKVDISHISRVIATLNFN